MEKTKIIQNILFLYCMFIAVYESIKDVENAADG